MSHVSTRRLLVPLTALAVAAGLAGCTSVDNTQQRTWAFNGPRLEIDNPNVNMPVSAVRGRDPEVTAKVTTQTVLRRASEPDWRLLGDRLHLGSPCRKGYVGLCEGRYVVVVPDRMTVTVNGRPVPVR